MTHWEKHRLGEHVEILSGFAFDSESFADSGEMPIVRIRDVVRGRSQTFYKGKYDERYVLRDGDLLIGMDGEFNLARWQGGPAVLNQRVCRIAASNGVLDDGYLFRFLPAALKAIEDVTPYVTVKHLSVKTIREIDIPVPPLAEQQRIAEVLDRADALRTKRRAALAQLDSLTQSIFLDMFGDPATNPKAWPRMVLGELSVNGFQNGLYKHSSHYGTGTPILRIDAFYDGVVTGLDTLKRLRASALEIETYGLHEGDVVVNRVNSIEYLGKSAIVPFLREPVVFESNMMRFAVDGKIALPSYIVAFLQSGFIKSQIGVAAKQAVNQASINQTDVAAFQFNIPPLSVQRTFVSRIAAVNKLKATHRAALTQLDALFASLQHRAFRGEL